MNGWENIAPNCKWLLNFTPAFPRAVMGYLVLVHRSAQNSQITPVQLPEWTGQVAGCEQHQVQVLPLEEKRCVGECEEAAAVALSSWVPGAYTALV